MELRQTVEIRVRGTVQGVGFRPTVWRLARDAGLVGEVFNDGHGVLIRTTGNSGAISQFLTRLPTEAPPLSLHFVGWMNPACLTPGPIFHTRQDAERGASTSLWR